MVKQDWSKGKIYMITCKNTNKKYIGKTTLTLEDEKKHNSNVIVAAINRIKNDKVTSYGIRGDEIMFLHFIIQGRDAMQYELLENTSSNSARELAAKQMTYIKEFNTDTSGLNTSKNRYELWQAAKAKYGKDTKYIDDSNTPSTTIPIVAPVVKRIAKPVVAPVVAPVVTPVIKPRATKPKTKSVVAPIITPKPTKITKPKTTNTLVAFIATKPKSKAGTDFNALLQKITTKATLQGLL